MLRIVYYTGATLGSGRLVFGISIANALVRNGIKCRYTMIHSSPVPEIADEYRHIKIPFENEIELSQRNFKKSVLYKTIRKLNPDIFLVNHQWFSVCHMIDKLKCKKIYLADYTYDSHFRIKLQGDELIFKIEQYDRVLGIEPFNSSIPMVRINPMIVRNRDEILSRDKALRRLGLDDGVGFGKRGLLIREYFDFRTDEKKDATIGLHAASIRPGCRRFHETESKIYVAL